MAGRTLSSVGRPFRSRRTMRTGAASTFSIRSPISSLGTLSTSNSQVHDATSCWSDPSVSATKAATWTSMPSGSKALRAAGICATGVSPGRAAPRRTSRYSPSDSQPVGRASPKLTSGWGTKPCEYATGSPLRRKARSHIRATSRWLVKRILPSLEKRRRSRRFSSGSTADELDRDAVALGEVLARALAPARRRHSRRHDVLEAELRAGATVVTRRPSAILDGNARERVLPVAPQKVAVQAGRDVVPRQRLELAPVAVTHLVEAQPLGGERLLPQREVEALGPLLERAPGAPDPFDDGAHPTVAPAGEPLGHRGGRVVPADGKPAGALGFGP